jgi:DNA replication and repair protein RecF
VLISGANGSGKTSLLEALHYACYLRSFRTYLPRELLSFNSDNFFIKVLLQEGQGHPDALSDQEIHIGFSPQKKLIKLNGTAIDSYKKLIQHYRIITVTEDDVHFIKGNPEQRRSFVDQVLVLHNPDFLSKMRLFKQILHNRNSLLQSRKADKASYTIWTHQLWEQSIAIHSQRQEFLFTLEKSINRNLEEYFSGQIKVLLQYKSRKGLSSSFEEFFQEIAPLYEQEVALGRSLFGAHLDDIVIQFQGKASKAFASRGQQKLSIMLLKIAVLQELQQQQGPVVFLLDDFMTDFDQKTSLILLDILTNLDAQLIFTSPVNTGFFEQELIKKGAQHLLLS